MKLFKSVDDKIKDLGYELTEATPYISVYVKQEDMGYEHKINLIHKRSGNHIAISYDPDLCDAMGIGNTAVGLTGEEMKLFAKKMKQMWG